MSKEFDTIKIYCEKCNTLLYKYHKYGSGHLIKCFIDQVKKDYTNGDMKCPNCQEEVARKRKFKGRDIFKIIQGKVYVKN
ncbi:MAG TPA: hypothetical protein VJ900_02035 [Patescibacteria group bacterium]|nr:hypothetical protein [Patescibacteria group bacterium]